MKSIANDKMRNAINSESMASGSLSISKRDTNALRESALTFLNTQGEGQIVENPTHYNVDKLCQQEEITMKADYIFNLAYNY